MPNLETQEMAPFHQTCLKQYHTKLSNYFKLKDFKFIEKYVFYTADIKIATGLIGMEL